MLGVEPQEELRSARSSDELASLAEPVGERGHPRHRDRPPGAALGGLRAAHRRRDHDAPRADGLRRRHRPGQRGHRALPATTGFSKFPVIKGTSDNVVGSVHVKQAVAVPRSERSHTLVREVMVDATVVPESLRLDPLLSLLRGEGFQMAIVSDEYGGTAGVVTLEDVVEEIVGRHRRRARPLRLPAATAARRVLDRLGPAPARRGRPTRPACISRRTRPTTPSPACSSASSAGSPNGATRCWCRCPVVIPEDDDEEPVQEHALLRVERMDGLRVDRISIKRLLARGLTESGRPHEHPGGPLARARPAARATRSSSARSSRWSRPVVRRWSRRRPRAPGSRARRCEPWRGSRR